jgi:hypothetical protein
LRQTERDGWTEQKCRPDLFVAKGALRSGEMRRSFTRWRGPSCRSTVVPSSIQVVSCPQGSWSNGGTSAPSSFSGNDLNGSDSDKKDTDDAGNDEGEDKQSGDREGDDGNPDDGDPDDPTEGTLTSLLPIVSFDTQAKVYATTTDTVSPKVLQKLQVNGRLIIQVSCLLFSSARKLTP